MSVEEGQLFFDFITRHKLCRCMELGFCHGVSSAYIGGAIQELGQGSLITIDRVYAKQRQPNIEWILRVTGLTGLVTPLYEERSFNWRLMKFLEQDLFEAFDFCYIDGGHTWYDTGFAYCLVSRLLRGGGWIAFDDLNFTYDKSRTANLPWVRRMPVEERAVPQVQKVFELLVEHDPFFGNFRRLGRFGFAQKTSSIWSEENNERRIKEVGISLALEQARSDPDFRRRLLNQPATAIAMLRRDDPSRYLNIRFEHTESDYPVFESKKADGIETYYLERPLCSPKRNEGLEPG